MSENIWKQSLPGASLPRMFNPHNLPQDAQAGYVFSKNVGSDKFEFSYLFLFPAFEVLIWDDKESDLFLLERVFRRSVRELVETTHADKKDGKNANVIFYRYKGVDAKLRLVLAPRFDWEKEINKAYKFFISKYKLCATDISFQIDSENAYHILRRTSYGGYFDTEIRFYSCGFESDSIYRFLHKTCTVSLTVDDLNKFKEMIRLIRRNR